MPAARLLGADLGRGRRRDHHVAGAVGQTRAARDRGPLHRLHPAGCRARRVYSAMSLRSASRPAFVSFNLVPPSSSKPHPFRRWIATQSISRSRSSASATCFNVSFSDGLRRGSVVFGLSIAGRSLYRTGAEVPRARWPARSGPINPSVMAKALKSNLDIRQQLLLSRSSSAEAAGCLLADRSPGGASRKRPSPPHRGEHVAVRAFRRSFAGRTSDYT